MADQMRFDRSRSDVGDIMIRFGNQKSRPATQIPLPSGRVPGFVVVPRSEYGKFRATADTVRRLGITAEDVSLCLVYSSEALDDTLRGEHGGHLVVPFLRALEADSKGKKRDASAALDADAVEAVRAASTREESKRMVEFVLGGPPILTARVPDAVSERQLQQAPATKREEEPRPKKARLNPVERALVIEEREALTAALVTPPDWVSGSLWEQHHIRPGSRDALLQLRRAVLEASPADTYTQGVIRELFDKMAEMATRGVMHSALCPIEADERC